MGLINEVNLTLHRTILDVTKRTIFSAQQLHSNVIKCGQLLPALFPCFGFQQSSPHDHKPFGRLDTIYIFWSSLGEENSLL